MRYAHQTDPNQTAVVDALRKAGCDVTVVSMFSGLGFDLIVTRADMIRLGEVKDGRLPPSKRKLTEAEKRAQRKFPQWWREWLCPEDALRDMGLVTR